MQSVTSTRAAILRSRCLATARLAALLSLLFVTSCAARAGRTPIAWEEVSETQGVLIA